MTLTDQEVMRIEQEIDHIVNKLTELGCDSVSVLTTMRTDGGTDCRCSFTGNYYARVGLMRQYIDDNSNVPDEGEEYGEGE